MRKPVCNWISLAAATAALLSGNSGAEDIDIYAKSAEGLVRRENVLIILDNSANWNADLPFETSCNDLATGTAIVPAGSTQAKKKFAVEKCALYDLITHPSVKSSPVSIGLMMYNEGTTGSDAGGYPRVRAWPMNEDGHADHFLAKLKAISFNNDQANSGSWAKGFHEAYLYLNQMAPRVGLNQNEYDGAPSASFISGGKYMLPGGTPCATHIIFIANGKAAENTDNQAYDLLVNLYRAAAVAGPTKKVYGQDIAKPDSDNWSDEYAEFMRFHSPTQILTHTISVVGGNSDGKFPAYV
ncbi:MAG TPA: hypothetical protein VHK24_09590, partial [Steroidobacter sp.]|nr:hypothetical protein [Steroidobacter sp.]